MELLDMKCAEYGYEIAGKVKDKAKIIKALGVLQEDGVYALFLYLKAKEGQDFIDTSFALLKDDAVLKNPIKETDPLEGVRERFKGSLDDLLLAKMLLERTLVYARYHAEAEGDK